MKQLLFLGRALTLAVVLAAIVSKTALAAPAPVNRSMCATHSSLTQPFLALRC